VNYQTAAASYNVVKNHSGVQNATPHRLIDMLFEGLKERISQARGAMEYRNIELKGKKINSAIAILSGLRENLNKDEGGDVAENLDIVYSYVQSVLAKAHREDNSTLLDEASTLIDNIHSAWKEIA